MNLNFACGDRIWDGFVNTDISPHPGAFYLDLEQRPYPYPDGSADVVMISHALFMGRGDQAVHPDLKAIMAEFHRILRPDGWLRIDDNPLRCYQDGEHVPAGEIEKEEMRGYPEHLRISRDELRGILRTVGFRRVEDVPPRTSHITDVEPEISHAVLWNSEGHASFTVEAQK